MNIASDDILTFWFEENGPAQWFKKDAAFDEQIRSRFLDTHRKAATGELWEWRSSSEGRLAEIIALDQFSRNIYRDDARAFAQDNMALILAQEAIHTGDDTKLTQQQRWVLYLPFMHSESLVIHEVAMRLFTELGMDDVLQYEIKHRDIIAQFNRYPHRNAVLGRASTEKEKEFLKEHSGF